MKKAVIILGVFLICAGGANASNVNLRIKAQVEFSTYGKSPFHLAVCKGDIVAVKKFIEYGVNINKKVNNMTPLMLAARFNHTEIIKILLENGANKSIENSHGFTALDYAEYAKSTESIFILKNKSNS